MICIVVRVVCGPRDVLASASSGEVGRGGLAGNGPYVFSLKWTNKLCQPRMTMNSRKCPRVTCSTTATRVISLRRLTTGKQTVLQGTTIM